jgi:hypothetical protein
VEGGANLLRMRGCPDAEAVEGGYVRPEIVVSYFASRLRFSRLFGRVLLRMEGSGGRDVKSGRRAYASSG